MRKKSIHLSSHLYIHSRDTCLLVKLRDELAISICPFSVFHRNQASSWNREAHLGLNWVATPPLTSNFIRYPLCPKPSKSHSNPPTSAAEFDANSMKWRPTELGNASKYPPIGLGSQGLMSGCVVLMYGIYWRCTCPYRAGRVCETRPIWRRAEILWPSQSAHLVISTATKHGSGAFDVQLKSRTSADRSIWPTDCSKPSPVNSRSPCKVTSFF